MNVFITGGSGYLATSLAFYLSKNNKIILGTRKPNKIKIEKKNIKIVKLDNYSKKNLNDKLRNVEAVIHLVGASKLKSKSTTSINIKKNSTSNIIEACEKNKVKKLIYLSSIQVYKKFEKKKKITENSELEKKSFYSLAHLKAEKIILNKKKNEIKNFIIIRASSIFGANIYSESRELIFTLVNNFCYQLVTTKTLKINNPEIVRNFLPLSVFQKFIQFVLKNNFSKNTRIINFGYKTLYLYQLAELLIKRYNKIFKHKPKLILPNYKKKNKKFLFKSKYSNNKYNKKIFLREIDKTLKLFDNLFNK